MPLFKNKRQKKAEAEIAAKQQAIAGVKQLGSFLQGRGPANNTAPSKALAGALADYIPGKAPRRNMMGEIIGRLPVGKRSSRPYR